MLNNYNNDAQVRDLMDHYDWHFLPVANPDGYDFTFSDVSDYTPISPPTPHPTSSDARREHDSTADGSDDLDKNSHITEKR